MNKYLRQLFIQSNIAPLVRLGYGDLRKKLSARHSVFQSQIKAWLFPEGPPRVLNGPFKGMAYLDEIIWGSITPRWLGSYEHELWDVMEEILSSPYDTLIDIGCAEGYYAAGLAWRLPAADIYAYDLDPFSREQCRKLWELNRKPGKLQIHSWCDHKEYASKHRAKTLCVIDIEGGEMDFLKPSLLPELSQSDLLIEVHQTSQDVSANAEELSRRFEQTHVISIIQGKTGRNANDFDLPVPLPEDEVLQRAFSEGRAYPQLWIWMKQKEKPDG